MPDLQRRVQQLRRVDAGGEAALQRVAVAAACRNSAQPDHGTIFDSFDEMSAIVSETPRLVPIDCAIS